MRMRENSMDEWELSRKQRRRKMRAGKGQKCIWEAREKTHIWSEQTEAVEEEEEEWTEWLMMMMRRMCGLEWNG